jgi:hypothetical protein
VTKVKLFKSMTANLISIGQLCDHGCIAMFDKEEVIMHHHNNNIILQGARNLSPRTFSCVLSDKAEEVDKGYDC